jgi:hypothetical protein
MIAAQFTGTRRIRALPVRAQFFSAVLDKKNANPIVHFPVFAFARIIGTASVFCGPSAYATEISSGVLLED